MSDRARSSVRTESREGSGTADEASAGAPPVDDRTASAGAAPANGARPAGASAVEADTRAARGTSARSSAPEPTAVEQTVAPTGAAAAQAAKPPAASPADEPAATASASKASTSKASTGNASASNASASKVAPAADEARPVTSTPPPVPPSTGTSRAVGAAHTRSGVPAAGSVPVDSTQAVSLPPAGARPAATPRPADQARTAAPGRTADQARPTDQTRTAGTRSAGEAAGAAAGKSKGKAGRGPRRARLQLRHVDTWSALKISLVLSIALFFVWMVAVGVLYMVLGGLGVFDSVNDLIGQVSSSSGEEGGGEDVINAGIVFGGAAVIGAINIVLLTALCTVGTFVYNLCSDLVGGLEVTLAERD